MGLVEAFVGLVKALKGALFRGPFIKLDKDCKGLVEAFFRACCIKSHAEISEKFSHLCLMKRIVRALIRTVRALLRGLDKGP